VWSDPRSGSQIEFASFEHMAHTAERGKFDFIFLAEGLRLREHAGLILDSDVVGRPNTTTVLAALSAVTTRLGLAGTLSSTFNEPYEVARQVATVDHLSAAVRRGTWSLHRTPGRARISAAAVSSSARTAISARRSSCEPVRELWQSWAPDALVGDKDGGGLRARYRDW
jgi:alkanesulfonate monooxygenase SsuD/methylene tetrahydromethanopterin reductase-like flavin-dependent oxidoreductase (luciferase family)